jgi:hypothetical protein
MFRHEPQEHDLADVLEKSERVRAVAIDSTAALRDRTCRHGGRDRTLPEHERCLGVRVTVVTHVATGARSEHESGERLNAEHVARFVQRGDLALEAVERAVRELQHLGRRAGIRLDHRDQFARHDVRLRRQLHHARRDLRKRFDAADVFEDLAERRRHGFSSVRSTAPP